MQNKKIGLYLCSYNYRDFILWALRSIRSQKRKPDFLLFIDDHSTDDTIEIVERELKRTGMKFDDIEINSENLGAVQTMNKAVDILIKNNCDYVCGLSADDMFHEDYLLLTEQKLNEAPKNVGYVYTWVRRIGDENSVDQHEEFNSDSLFKYNFVHGSSLIKSEAWQIVGGLPDVKVCEDWEMFKNMARLGIIGTLLPKPLLLWRKHNKGSRTEGRRGK